MGYSLSTTNAFTGSHIDTQLSTSSMSIKTSAGGGINVAMENVILQHGDVSINWATANTLSSVAGSKIIFRGSDTGTNGAEMCMVLAQMLVSLNSCKAPETKLIPQCP